MKFVFLSLTLFVGCFANRQDNIISDEASSNVIVESRTTLADLDVLPSIQTETVVKNYIEINASMSKATGVPLTANEISGTFNEAGELEESGEFVAVQTNLPRESDSEQYSKFSQVGVTRLASAYCDLMLFGDDNLDPIRTPESFLGQGTFYERRVNLREGLMSYLLNREILGQEEWQAVIDQLNLVLGLENGDGGPDPIFVATNNNSNQLAHIGCTLILASAHFVTK